MPRASLTRAAVVELALEVVDEVGFDRLTLSAVAARAGVAVPSLYKHVGGLPDLRREVAIVAVRGFTAALETAALETAALETAVLETAATGDPAGALHRTADAVRGYARRHPGRYAAVQVAADPDDPADAELAAAGADAVRATAAALRPVTGDLAGAELVHAIRAVRSAMHGFVLLEMQGGFRMAEDVDASYAYLVTLLQTALSTPPPPPPPPSP